MIEAEVFVEHKGKTIHVNEYMRQRIAGIGKRKALRLSKAIESKTDFEDLNETCPVIIRRGMKS